MTQKPLPISLRWVNTSKLGFDWHFVHLRGAFCLPPLHQQPPSPPPPQTKTKEHQRLRRCRANRGNCILFQTIQRRLCMTTAFVFILCSHDYFCHVYRPSDSFLLYKNVLSPRSPKIPFFIALPLLIYFSHVYYPIHTSPLFSWRWDLGTNARRGMGSRTKAKWRWLWKVLSPSGQMSWKDGSTGGLF